MDWTWMAKLGFPTAPETVRVREPQLSRQPCQQQAQVTGRGETRSRTTGVCMCTGEEHQIHSLALEAPPPTQCQLLGMQ